MEMSWEFRPWHIYIECIECWNAGDEKTYLIFLNASPVAPPFRQACLAYIFRDFTVELVGSKFNGWMAVGRHVCV